MNDCVFITNFYFYRRNYTFDQTLFHDTALLLYKSDTKQNLQRLYSHPTKETLSSHPTSAFKHAALFALHTCHQTTSFGLDNLKRVFIAQALLRSLVSRLTPVTQRI